MSLAKTYDFTLLSNPTIINFYRNNKEYCYEFVNIVNKICIYCLFLNYNISDARGIFIFGEKSRDFS